MRQFCAAGQCALLVFVILTTTGFAQTSPADQSEHPAQAAPTTPPTTPPTAPSPEHTATPGAKSGHDLIVRIVVSVSSETFVIRTEDNQFHLFVFDRGLVRPRGFVSGAHVRVEYTSSGESGVGLATQLTILDETGATTELPPPPIELRETQREIERLARRWQFGFRVGAGLDPELFLVGVHTNIRLSRDLSFRPNA